VLTALDDPMLRAAFGREVAPFGHDLLGRPELAIDAIAAIAATVPATWVAIQDAPDDPHLPRECGRVYDCPDVAQLVRSLATARASVRLYNLERLPEYADLVDGARAVVDDLVGEREGGLDAVNLGVFAASPHSVTPAHPDLHHNLLLQLTGTKEIWIEHDPDRRAQHARVLQYLSCPDAGTPELPPAELRRLNPGDALYIPPYTFHWTRTGDEPGTALSIGFATPATRIGCDALAFDVRLRRRGLRPRPHRAGSLGVRAKARLEHVVRTRSRGSDAAGGTVSADPGGAS
jgi:hypothetical protein